MSVEAALYTRLTSGHTATSALIGTRCYPLRLPQKPTLPAIVYQRISSSPQIGTTDRRGTRFQFSCWASTYAGAKALAAQVRAALENHADTTVRMGRVVNEIDDFDETVELQRVILDAFLTINE